MKVKELFEKSLLKPVKDDKEFDPKELKMEKEAKKNTKNIKQQIQGDPK